MTTTNYNNQSESHKLTQTNIKHYKIINSKA